MSVDIPYVRRSIDAAFRLAMRDENAWTQFDLTASGFYRSFAALLVVIPLNILITVLAVQLVAAQLAERHEAVPAHVFDMSDAVFVTVALCVQWLIFPLVMIVVTRFLQLEQRYSALVIAHNWGTVVVALFNLPPLLLYATGLVSADHALNLNFIVLGLTLYYRYYITQTALASGWSAAAAIMLLDFVLQVYFEYGTSLVAGLWLAPG